jgi:lysophospholipase L1-like esterase
MNLIARLILPGRLLLTMSAAAMAILVNLTWVTSLGILALGISAILRDLGRSRELNKSQPTALILASSASLVALCGAIASKGPAFMAEGYFAVQSGSIAVALWPAPGIRCPGSLTGWKGLALGWVMITAFISLAAGYVHNRWASFLIGLILMLLSAILAKRWFRLSWLAVQAVNTAILIVIGLPLVDLVTKPWKRIDQRPEELDRYYSYAAAKQNPGSYVQWANYFRRKWHDFESTALIREPKGPMPFRLRPGTDAWLFRSHVRINSMGFRGQEFSKTKGDAYRIIALGESSTFGITLRPDDKPWPELLEQLIHERLKPVRPVEVINAGIPAAALPQNVYRLKHELLALDPDLVISYHGFNGFYLLDRALPRAHGRPPPQYQSRPIKILGDLEYRLKLAAYNQKVTARLVSAPPAFAQPMQTEYARVYRELIDVCRSNDVQLLLGNFSMAVNLQSDPKVIEFFRSGWPEVQIQHQLKANLAHSFIVEQLAREHPEVCFVDTQPFLDGRHEKFIDLMHFDAKGERQMAETIFAGVKPLLDRSLSAPAKRAPIQ